MQLQNLQLQRTVVCSRLDPKQPALSPRTVLSSRRKTKGQTCPYRGPSFMGFAIRKVMATKKCSRLERFFK
jgi:hypothetical protein